MDQILPYFELFHFMQFSNLRRSEFYIRANTNRNELKLPVSAPKLPCQILSGPSPFPLPFCGWRNYRMVPYIKIKMLQHKLFQPFVQPAQHKGAFKNYTDRRRGASNVLLETSRCNKLFELDNLVIPNLYLLNTIEGIKLNLTITHQGQDKKEIKHVLFIN